MSFQEIKSELSVTQQALEVAIRNTIKAEEALDAARIELIKAESSKKMARLEQKLLQERLNSLKEQSWNVRAEMKNLGT